MAKVNKTPQPPAEVAPIPGKQFNSISEIVEDPIFRSFVHQNILELHKARCKRPQPKPGYHYPRDWYDRMSDDGNVNLGFFIENIENIWLKKSLLSSQERDGIQYVCDISLQQTFLEYSKQSVPKTETSPKNK